MKKTFKVVMLPTEKASDIQLISNKFLHLIENFGVGLSKKDKLKGSTNTPQHLYILSDERTKQEKCWHYNYIFNTISCEESTGYKKIVATTDKLNTHPNVADSYRSGNCLPQLPESFIQAYIKAYNEGKPITEVDLEVEYYNKPENGHSSVRRDFRIKTRSDNTVIVHQSKMYTREDVIGLLIKLEHETGSTFGRDFMKQWIQDNL